MPINTLLLLSFQVSTFLVPWLLVIWLTYNSNADSVGQFSYILALISPLCMLLASPSRNFILSSQTFDIQRALDVRKLLGGLGLILATIIGLVLQQMTWVLAIYFVKITEMLYDLGIAKHLKLESPLSLIKLNALKWLSIVTVVICSFVVNDITVLMLLLGVFFVLTSLGLSSFQKINFDGLLSALREVLPLSFSALVFSLYFNIPRYVLGNAGETELLAVFTISSFLLMGALVFINTLMQANLHKMAVVIKMDKSQQLFKIGYRSFFWLLATYVALQICQMEWFSELFWQAHNQLNANNPILDGVYQQVLMLSLGPMLFSFANYFLMATSKHKQLLSITIINAVVTFVIANTLFIKLGILGLLWVVNISGLGQFLAVLFVLRKAMAK
jgi:O-antigen/teichoic acid export membrane protein